MNEHSLPDDPARWPNDPYRLLGVDHTDDGRTIRRAYVRLIRRFKPDLFPEHFQRIHAAYEFVSEFAPTALQREETDESEPLDRETPGDGDSASPERASAERADEDVRGFHESRASLSDDVASPDRDPAEEERIAWEAAFGAEPADAYAKLVDLQADENASDTACIRLYWMLTAMPELDESRRPCDWLVEALRRTGCCGPAAELYAREIRRNPPEILEDRCADLLGYAREAHALFQLFGIRWRAFGILEYPGRILDDLTQFREAVTPQDVDLWVFGLVMALDQLAWSREDAAVRQTFDAIGEELEQISRAHGRFHDELSHIDRLVEIADGAAALKSVDGISDYWPNLICFTWTHSDESVPRELQRAAGRIADDPFEGLKTLRHIGGISPVAMHYLGSLFLDPSDHQSRCAAVDEEELKTLLYRFLYLRRGARTPADELLLEFCLREDVPPAELDQHGEFVANHLRDRVPEFANLPQNAVPVYRDDGPLHYVYAACRRTWGRRLQPDDAH